ncbi:MAG TPA: hypothetical protein VI792_03275 [Candidatus Eisenbacteria bacterium]
MRDNAGPQRLGESEIQEIIKPRMVSFFNNTGATLAFGNAVIIDVAQAAIASKGVPAFACIKLAPAVAADARKIRGGVAADIPDQQFGLVQVAGVMVDANVITGTAADEHLIGSVTTAGRLIVATYGAGEVLVALNLALAASNKSTVLWRCAGI